MDNSLLSPLFAFLIYGALIGILSLASSGLSVHGEASQVKSSSYACGEEQDDRPAAPGYRPFSIEALFFAILHLGVLMLALLAPILG